MTYQAFDIVVVPFPYSDRLAEKRRPALVVSDPVLEQQRGLVWVAMITSATHTAGFADTPITDLGGAGLPAASIVRSGKVATIEPSRILRRLGALSPKDREAARAALALCAAF